MQEYHVVWRINIFAETPRDAAEKAFEIMNDPETTATVFEVEDENANDFEIDLMEE